MLARSGTVALLGILLTWAPLPGQQARGVESGPRMLTLEGAVTRAVERNAQLQAARFALDEANERVSEAWGSVFPSLDLTTSYTRNIAAAVNFLPANIFDPTADPDELVPVRFGADNLWALSLGPSRKKWSGGRSRRW
jgi:outer membrane protein TolC